MALDRQTGDRYFGQKVTVQATVSSYGKSQINWKDKRIKVCLVDLSINGMPDDTDHVWIRSAKAFIEAGIPVEARVQFRVRVIEYKSQGHYYYGLETPDKVLLIEEEESDVA